MSEDSDKLNEIVVDMVPQLEQPPTNVIMRVTEVVRVALREAFPDCGHGGGFGFGEADLDLTVDGFHVWITIAPSATQKKKGMQ